jgi:predicted CopG family antitoxin
MATKTISLETDAYQLLKREKQPKESFSQVVRRIIRDRPALTAGELEEAMKPLRGYGAGPRRKARRAAA